MEVILNQDVNKIGKAGSVVKVKDGFARNFLIPNRLAVPLTPENLKRLQQEKEKKAADLQKAQKEAGALQEKLAALSLTIPALARDENALYGSITALDLAAALQEEGLTIDKNAILLDEPIKSLGIYEVPIKLFPDILAKVKVWIVKK